MHTLFRNTKDKCKFPVLGKMFLFLNFLFIYSHVHTVFGSFLSPAPHPLLLSPASLPGKTCSALISNFVEEKT
jgi:hypothetical protein